MAMRHVSAERLYRIFYYDCPPYEKKEHNPITGLCVDFARTDEAAFRRSLFSELKKRRKVALRLGVLKNRRGWLFHPGVVKALKSGARTVSDLTGNDVFLDLTQKGVDMKIGVDIASLAYKRLVSKIILISGDSDFVPAAKLARREGIDFVLDPMWNPIAPDLHEHIDGLQSNCRNPQKPGHR